MIQDIFNALKARYPADFLFLLGKEYLLTHAMPQRIVVVPTTEQFGPSEGGGRDVTGRALSAIATRIVTLEVHLWGNDLAQAEAMLHEFVRYIHQDAGVSGTLGAGYWLGKDQAGWLTKGEVFVLPVQFKVPVLKKETFAKITKITQPYDVV